jgi:hypothetical protein
VKVAVRFVQGGAAVALTAPVFTASGIKAQNDFTGSYLIQLSAPVLSDTTLYTFTVSPLNSAQLNTFLQTYRNTWCALEIYDSANGILTTPLELQIMPGYSLSGTPTDNVAGVIAVAAGKTVTFPQSLTFPSALGTNGFQLTTDGAGALTWTASGALTDGDKGEITVSASGATWTIDNDVVTLAKLAHMPTARVIGRTTGGTGSPELLTISGTGSVAMTNTPTLVTPVLGAATATSINGITITAGGSGTLTMEGDINTGAAGGSLYLQNGGGTIDLRGTGSIEFGVTTTRTTLTGSATADRAIALPNAAGTILLNDNTATITNKDIVATQLSGNVAVARIATALASPGTIGNTTAATSVKIANGSAASTALQIGAVSNGIYSPSGAGTDVGISANGALVAFWNSSWGLVALQPIIPNSNGLTSVGTSGLRWSNVFSVLGNFSGAVTCSTTLSVSSTTTMTGRLTANGGITVVGGTNLLTTNTALTDQSSGNTASLGNVSNAPVPGDPTKWIAINDNGTTLYIPTWRA